MTSFPPRHHSEAIQSISDIRRACHPPIVCGIPSIDLLNNLPTAMACDGLLFDVEFLGAWIAPAGAVRFVLRPVDGPPEDAFGFTIGGHATGTDPTGLAAALWQDLRQARDLVGQGTTGLGTPDALRIRWLTDPADDLPWTGRLPRPDDPTEEEPAQMFTDDPAPSPGKKDPLRRPDWPGAVNMVNLRYRWRGTTWATTQLAWFIAADKGHRGWPRPYPSAAYWVTSPTRFHTIFHDPMDGRSDEHIRAARTFLPNGQRWPRWGLTYFAGGLWQNNWDPGYPDEISFGLTEVTRGTPPAFQSHPEMFQREHEVTWLLQGRDISIPPTFRQWTSTMQEDTNEHPSAE